MLKKITNTVLALIIVLALLLFAGFAWYPSLVQRQPEYAQAKAICDSIAKNMSYEEVRNKVGHLFFSEPMTYLDDRGNGQAQLKNSVKGLDTSCLILFQDGKVTSSAMAYSWL